MQGRADDNSGYVRLLGNKELGLLVSRLHAAVIRAGSELEHVLKEHTKPSLKAALEDAQQCARERSSTAKQVVFRPRLRKGDETYGVTGDMVVFDHRARHIRIIEVKDGDTFDTKKSSGELQSMRRFADTLEQETGYQASICFCSFNQKDRQAIVSGTKGRFSVEQVMTGMELCKELEVDYDLVVRQREAEQSENLDYFLDQLISIPEVRKLLSRKLKGSWSERSSDV